MSRSDAANPAKLTDAEAKTLETILTHGGVFQYAARMGSKALVRLLTVNRLDNAGLLDWAKAEDPQRAQYIGTQWSSQSLKMFVAAAGCVALNGYRAQVRAKQVPLYASVSIRKGEATVTLRNRAGESVATREIVAPEATEAVLYDCGYERAEVMAAKLGGWVETYRNVSAAN